MQTIPGNILYDDSQKEKRKKKFYSNFSFYFYYFFFFADDFNGFHFDSRDDNTIHLTDSIIEFNIIETHTSRLHIPALSAFDRVIIFFFLIVYMYIFAPPGHVYIH